MTDKQIIIDDCIHLNEWKHCDICEKLIKTKDSANGKKREHLLTEEDLRCDFYPNCYYKQLKHKEQECEELKETLAEIKEIAETISQPMGTGKSCNRVILAKQILQKISECEGNNDMENN